MKDMAIIPLYETKMVRYHSARDPKLPAQLLEPELRLDCVVAQGRSRGAAVTRESPS